jgi:hypothetical protein
MQMQEYEIKLCPSADDLRLVSASICDSSAL